MWWYILTIISILLLNVLVLIRVTEVIDNKIQKIFNKKHNDLINAYEDEIIYLNKIVETSEDMLDAENINLIKLKYPKLIEMSEKTSIAHLNAFGEDRETMSRSR